MGFESGFDEKIDVIDLIINVLKEHEKKLDELVSRLEEAQAVGAPVRAQNEREQREEAPPSGVAVSAALDRWSEFAERCASAELVAFDADGGRFRVSAVSGGVLYKYEEEIPDMEIRYRKTDGKAHIESIDISSVELVPGAIMGRLECGLKLEKNDVEVSLPDGASVNKISFSIDPGVAKSWIAYQLGIDEDTVVRGELKA